MKISKGSLRPTYSHMTLTSSWRLSMNSSSLTYYIAERIRGIRSKLACHIQKLTGSSSLCMPILCNQHFELCNVLFFFFCLSWLRLVQSFNDFADHYNIEKIPVFEERFPKEFSLCHVVEIWKYTAKYQEKLRRRRAF